MSESPKESVQEAVESAVEKVSNVVANVIPHPSSIPLQPQSDVHSVKSRLEWGDPAFTILDVRERSAYNNGRILGALPTPIDQLVERAKLSLEKIRDIYVYGDTNQQSAEAAQLLRSAGFERVSELKGGLAAWKAIGGSTEGIVES